MLRWKKSQTSFFQFFLLRVKKKYKKGYYKTYCFAFHFTKGSLNTERKFGRVIRN